MPSTAFGFIQYLEYNTFSETWLRATLQRLWQEGLRFSGQEDQAMTWEAELQTMCACYIGSEFQELPLAAGVAQLARQGNGMLTVWDRSIDLKLSFGDHPFISEGDSPGASSVPGYKRILLTIDDTFFHTPGNRLPPARETLYPFQQAELAFLHWSEVLCRATGPLFALGVEPDWTFTLEGTTTTYTREAELALARAIHTGTFPVLPPWVSSLYLGARFAPATLIEEASRLPDLWIKRFPDGSLFLFWNPAESFRGFHYMAGEVYRLSSLAGLQTPFELPTQTPDWDEQLRKAFEIYDRAVELARAIGYEAGARMNQRAIADLMERAARLKAAGQRLEG